MNVSNEVIIFLSILRSAEVPTKWRYAPSKSNPADCASRGLMPQQFAEHPLWFIGNLLQSV